MGCLSDSRAVVCVSQGKNRAEGTHTPAMGHLVSVASVQEYLWWEVGVKRGRRMSGQGQSGREGRGGESKRGERQRGEGRRGEERVLGRKQTIPTPS